MELPRLASFQIPQAGDRWTLAPYIHAGKGGYLNFILLPLSAQNDLSNTVGF